MSAAITPVLVDRLVAHLEQRDDPYDPRRLWQGLCFMEEHGIDWSMRSCELIGYIRSSPHSPVPNAASFTDEDLRILILALRDKARAALGIPPLSEAEKGAWRFVPGASRPRSQRQAQTKVYGENFGGGLDPAEVRARVAGKNPELMRVLRLFISNNRVFPKGSPLALSLMWLDAQLQELIIQEYPSVGGIDAIELADWIVANEDVAQGKTETDGDRS